MHILVLAHGARARREMKRQYEKQGHAVFVVADAHGHVPPEQRIDAVRVARGEGYYFRILLNTIRNNRK